MTLTPDSLIPISKREAFVEAAKRMAGGIYFAHTECEPKCEGCYACKGDVEQLVANAGIKAGIEFDTRYSVDNSLNDWPENVIAERHEVSGKWVIHYLTDDQAVKCHAALQEHQADQPQDVRCGEIRDNEFTDILTGGNHLASALTPTCLPNEIKSYDEALQKFGHPYADMWIAWNCIMKARPFLRTTEPVMSKQPIETAPKGVPVIVASGVAMQKTGGEWFTGMETPLYKRPLEWEPKWWMPIPTDNN